MARERPTQSVPFGTTPSERVTMTRALAALYCAGGLLVIATMALPHAENTAEAGVVGPGLLAVIVGVLLNRFADRVSVHQLQLLLAAGACLVTICVIFGGDSASAYPFLYLWVSLYAYYFFNARHAAALVALCIALHAGALHVEGHTPVPSVYWVMATGSTIVGGLLIGRLTAAIRAQAEDLTTVSRMAGGLSDVEDFAQETCESLRGSSSADVVIFLEPVEAGAGLQVTAMAGASEAGMAFAGDAARKGLERAFRTGEPIELMTDTDAPGGRFAGHALGLAQPVVLEGRTVAILAVAWTRPRRQLPERLYSAAVLFAAEASLAIERAQRRSADRERAALEINDNIVQGLVVAKYCAQRGDTTESLRAIDETLARARQLITDQLENVSHGSGTIRPGDLARSQASSVDMDGPTTRAAG